MTLRLSMEGESAILLDAGTPAFDDSVQERVWAVAEAMRDCAGVREAVPGMNNVMVVFDPLAVEPVAIEDALRTAWEAAVAGQKHGREIDVPVTYGGTAGDDLDRLANGLGLSAAEVVERHAAATYRVAAVGFTPGFVYLSGLDPRLAVPRRAVPRAKVPAGSVMIGGAQTGIMPREGPTGWHVIGWTPMVMFDTGRDPPATFQAGDRVRFKISSLDR